MNERIEKIEAMLQASPNDLFLHHALAMELIKLGDDSAARKHFEHNLRTDANYVGTYYHLGKLLARNEEQEQALAIYEKGMAVAKKLDDRRSYSELQAAYDDLNDD